MIKVPVEVSARHCHLSRQHIDKLFGKGYQLKELKKVSQPGQYASKEKIKIKGPKGELSLRIVAPERKQTQVELTATECYWTGIKPVLRISGDLKGSAGAVLIGPKGQIKINKGVIVAQRHLHLSSDELKKLKLRKGQNISIKVKSKRGLRFDNVVVRTGDEHKMAFQIDTDEGNGCGWKPGLRGELVV